MVELGLTDAQFYRLQPRQLDALIRRHNERTMHAEFLAGQIAQAVVNYGFCRPEKLKRVADFMPSRMKPPAKPRYQSREKVAEGLGQMMRGIMAKQQS